MAIRVEAGDRIGVGHAMRCATLAAALRGRGHRISVVTRGLPDWVADRFDGAALIAPSDDLRRQALDGVADVWVVDGYTLSQDLLALAEAAVPIVAIDDNHELPVASAGLVLNQNLHATASMYPDVETERLLLGPSFALLRDDVVELSRQLEPLDGDRVLLAFGGTDPAGLTLPVARALSDVQLVVALAHDHPDRAAVAELSNVAFDRGDLLDGLGAADVAVIGGGSTLWEVAVCGLPAIAVVVAENQVDGTAAAAAAGFVESIDARNNPRTAAEIAEAVRRLRTDRRRRLEMGEAGRTLFDGRGAARVATAVAELA